MSNLNIIPSTLQNIARRAKRIGYKLPGNPERDVYCIPVSGGADSSALAIVFCHLFPWLREKAVFTFTDTKAETEGLYEALDALEAYLGVTIHRITPEKGLFELVDAQGGFLPSAQQRWCTRVLKIQPWERFVKSLLPAEEGDVYTFIGIRADEAGRLGAFSKDLRVFTESPFKTLSVKRNDVYSILQATIGVPGFYRHRTRSGCSSCFGQRRSEVIALERRAPEQFRKGMAYEKLSEEDLSRYAVKALSVAKETGIGGNHLSFPLPPSWEPHTKKHGRRPNGVGTSDLFSQGVRDVFVGVEFFVNLAVGGEGVWWQEFVSFSTTRSGLHRQLAGHWFHRLKTAEVYGLTPTEMAQELKLVAYHLELPAHVLRLERPSKDSFTWRVDDAYAQLSHVVSWVVRALHAEGLHQEVRSFRQAKPGSYREERRSGLTVAQTKLKAEAGRLVNMSVFNPPEQEPEEDEREITCIACSI